MPPPESLGLFTIAALILLVIPGPAVLYIVTRSVTQGTRAGFASILGLATGTIIHVAAAAAGLSVLLATSALAFQVVKYAGAAYLIYLGVQKFRASPESALVELRPDKPSRIFLDGIIVNLLNPKSALFFFAFLPQFISADRPAAPQILTLGALFLLLSMITDSCYVFLAGSLRKLLRSSRPASWGQYVAGTIYIGLGVAAAFAGQKPQ
jgi:threonine/homoserine/homoserine lactone efflux protein